MTFFSRVIVEILLRKCGLELVPPLLQCRVICTKHLRTVLKNAPVSCMCDRIAEELESAL